MHEIRTEIAIDAPASKVWAELVDFAAHAHWNPFILGISGVPRVGERLAVVLRPEGGRAMRFRPTVLAATPERELRWRGRLLLPGLFDGEHYFLIRATGAGSSRLVHGEKFSGWLVGLAKSSLDRGTRAGFEAMNRALKARAEGRPPEAQGDD